MAQFDVLNLESEPLDPNWVFDFIYVRLVFSHLKDPQALLNKLSPHLKPQGILAVEDVYFDGHHCTPPCNAFDRYVTLYKAAAQQRGADANIGPRLETMIRQVGYRNIQVTTVTPEFTTGDGKLMALITMEAISNAVVQMGLETRTEADNILRELAEFTLNPSTVMGIPTFYQVHGTSAR